MGTAEIVRSLDKNGIQLWSALTTCCDTYKDDNGMTQIKYVEAYVIYGESTRESLVKKLEHKGYVIR